MNRIAMDNVLKICAPYLNDKDLAHVAGLCLKGVPTAELAQDAALRTRLVMACDAAPANAAGHAQAGAALSPVVAKALSRSQPRPAQPSGAAAADIATAFPNMGRL